MNISPSDILTFKDCLAAMDKGEAFSVTYLTYDEKRPDNTGNLRHLDEAMLLVHAGKLYGLGRGITKIEEGTAQNVGGASSLPDVESTEKNTKKVSSRYFIRDIQPLTGRIPVGHPVRLHPRLILFFNGKKVMP
jgi:hypothetical protein